jgi:hypothetical protein
MQEVLLREIAESYLVPFFSGSLLEENEIFSMPDDEKVYFADDNRIYFKIEENDSYHLCLYRPQVFVKEQKKGYIVSEITVVKAFVEVLAYMSQQLRGPLKRDLLSTFERRVVAKSLGEPKSSYVEENILSAIDQLAQLSNRSYEGSSITTSFGFRHKSQGIDAPTIEEIGSNDFGLLLSNGLDTLQEYDFHGRFITESLLPIPDNVINYYAPLRHAATARWTSQDSRRQRVALVLNRRGEILIFRDGQLLFTRRGGRWSFLTHRPIVTQMGRAFDRVVRRALYDTALDASFARAGACLGLVSENSALGWKEVVVNPDDHLEVNKSVKARTLNRIVQNVLFQDLDRRLRLELVSIDGATVISHEGAILAVGAILRIPGGSESGGRLAAAKALSAFGLGVKVSQDGGISGYRETTDSAVFRVM